MSKLNLVPAIKAIEEEIAKIRLEYEGKLAPYYDSLTELRKINTACENCSGTGKVLRSCACAEDDAPNPDDPEDWEECPLCWGTGGNRLTRGTDT